MTQTAATVVAIGNIKARMGRLGLSQRDLAERLGISQPAFSARLAGRTPIDLHELDVIAEALGVSPADLLKDAA